MQIMRAAFTVVVCSQLVLAIPAFGQRPDSVFRIPDVVVRVVRPLTTVGGAAILELKIDSLALPPAASVEQVFRSLPMLHVRTNSRGEAEISARGSESRQVAVLVDGVPISIAWDARADVSVLPATGIQELSFVRGLSSMLHGPNVLGGVVEIGVGRSSVQPARSSLLVDAGFDHIGGYGAGAALTLPGTKGNGDWLFRVGGSYRNSPGHPLADGVVEPVPADDDDLRLNTDVDNAQGFVALRYARTNGAWLSFSGSSFRAERGIAAELGSPAPRFWRYPEVSRTLAVISGGTGDHDSPFGGRGDVELSLGLDAGRTDIDSYTDRTYSEINGFDDGKDRTLTLRALADQTVGERGELRAAFTLSEIRHDEFLPATPTARYRQRLLSAGAETNWRLLENGATLNTVRVSVGAAFDRAETAESGGREPRQEPLDNIGGRIGVTAALHGGQTLLHGGASKRARFPALRELYSGALNRFQPNPELRPEQLTALEMGVTRKIGSGEVQAAAFHHSLEDAVVRITLPDGRFLRVNQNELKSVGVELLATQALGSFAFTGDLTVQSVDLTNTAAGETNRPEHLPEVFGRLTARFPIALGVRGMTEVDYIGDQFCIDLATGGDTKLEAGTHLNAQLSREWSIRPRSAGWLSRMEARIAADNIGDVARYDQCGLPQPGRLLRFQLRLF